MEIRYDLTYKLFNDNLLNTDKAVLTLLESGYKDNSLHLVYKLLEKFADLLIVFGKTLKSRVNHTSAYYVTG